MMSCAKLLAALVLLLAVGAVSAVVIHAELSSNITDVASRNTVVTPSNSWLAQHIQASDRAAKRSANEDIREDCEALQKLATTDPECAQLSSHGR